MNVQVKHNGSNITGYVISYERVHKICTGIGTLTVELDRGVPGTFDPWDTIDIYENGSFKVRYYISNTNDSIPKGTLTLDCQDVSKRLVDYFIPDSYTIDYPSYTRYWIEKFLTEAGIDYTFTTSSQGNLISNNTQLGLTSAYEQILTLLQMSGWFIYFNQSEKAVIGNLNADLAVGSRSVGRTDILDINRVSDDKMLRNRALVLGAFDPYSLKYATADVTVHTPWNYDNRDVRAIVISNSNIPNKNSAYGIANQLIKEFARITIEKHITLWGARNYNLGEALRVNSTVWRGKGLITTFGTSMSKQGLVTNIVLDERCPRLFGFFDYGDYVYVGTYGDGIWKKHIKFDPNWYDFSTGLTNLEITDLHINNGIFGSVGSSGQIYRALEDSSWSLINVSGFLSSSEGTVASGNPVNYVPFSGLMGRAVIVDKLSNTLKFGIDNASGMNYGDYFLDFYGSGNVSSSGITASGNHRGWIVEYDPFTGNPVGGIGSGIYPINYSGSYDFSVLDLENDGSNDYVSVKGSGSLVTWDDGYNFGSHITSLPNSTHDPNSVVGIQSLSYELEGQTKASTLSTSCYPTYSVFHNELNDERDIVWVNIATSAFKRVHFYKAFNAGLGRNEVLSTTDTSATQTGVGTVVGIYKSAPGVYRIFHYTQTGGTGGTGDLSVAMKYRTWDTSDNSVTSDTTLNTLTITDDPNGTNEFKTPLFITINDNIYCYISHMNMATGGANLSNYVKIHRQVTDMAAASSSNSLLATFNFEDYHNFPGPYWNIRTMTSTNPFSGLFQGTSNPVFSMWVSEWNDETAGFATVLRNWMIYSLDGTTFNIVKVQETNTSSDTDFLLTTNGIGEGNVGANQLANDRFIFYAMDSSGTTKPAYVFNGSTVTVANITDVPFYWKASNIYAMFGSFDDDYIAKDGSNWYWIDSHTYTQGNQITFPANFTPTKPYSRSSDTSEEFFWQGTNSDTFNKEILKLSKSNGELSRIVPYSQPVFGSSRAIIVGNMFIESVTTLRVLYVDNVFPPTNTVRYLVLQREGSDFNLIQSATYPIRLDISNSSPVLTVGSGENSFVSNFVYSDMVEQIIFASGNVITVNDYRYTYFEPVASGIITSGIALSTMGMYVSGSGIYGGDVMSYSGGFSILASVPSGYGNRIETSNFGLGGQYVFITTSGDYPAFYQADPGMLAFTSYSGLPQSRATIIRLDDRM